MNRWIVSLGVSLAIIIGLASGCGQADGLSRGGIVSLAPHLTETVFAVQQGNRVVAVGDFCDFPADVQGLPRIGGYLDPDLEQLAMLAPDLILLPGQHQKVSEFARIYGLEVVNVHMDSLQGIEEGILEIGAALNAAPAAAAVLEEFHAEKAALRAGLEDVERPKVLIITSRASQDMSMLNTVGQQSFISEIVELAGGTNIYNDVDRAYFEASKEDIVLRAPEVIIEFRPGEHMSGQQRQQLFNDWRRFESLPAVERAAVHFIFESHALRPGPRIVEIARHIAGLLHPVEVARL